eukprot:9886852-Lingulodinium_polyedra.AAC.1
MWVGQHAQEDSQQVLRHIGILDLSARGFGVACALALQPGEARRGYPREFVARFGVDIGRLRVFWVKFYTGPREDMVRAPPH